MNEPDALPTIAANDGSGWPPMGLTALGGVTDIADEQADWDDPEYGWLYDGDDSDQPDPDPCNYCPHDNADHRGDGCLHCGCDVPQ